MGSVDVGKTLYTKACQPPPSHRCAAHGLAERGKKHPRLFSKMQ